MARPTNVPARPPWTRRYPPLLAGVAALVCLLTLPSALTQPQNNPSAALELAPVPPSQENVANQISNSTTLTIASSESGLGNGSTNGGAGGRTGKTLPPTPPPSTAAAQPTGPGGVVLPTLAGTGKPINRNKNCVDGRQSSDPLTPPCVDHYEGNNGGATYQGVTASEFRVIIYYDAVGTINTARGTDTPPYNTIVDVNAPPSQDEIAQTFVNRYWQQYFYNAYQTYNRLPHLFVQYGSYGADGTSTPQTQAADAAKGYNQVHPFAVINYSAFGNGAYYNNYMAQHGVMIFGSQTGRSESFYDQFPGQQWGYFAPVERSASQFSDFVCTTLVNKPPDEMGQSAPPITAAKRKFGLIIPTDPKYQALTSEAQTVQSDIQRQCGITIASSDIATYDRNGFSVDANPGDNPAYAVNGMTAMKNDGVTTVLWPAGYENKFGTAADNLKYYPEFILGDDDLSYSDYATTFQDQTAFSHAYVVASITYNPYRSQQLCFQYYRTVDPNSADSDVVNFACPEYNDLRQLFIGVQVAGPDLSPKSVDRGFHAIPQKNSTDPQTPSCFYLPGDYTCVKDSTVEHWDPAGPNPNANQPGCWRMSLNGKRYLAGQFPTQNLADLTGANDVCNGFGNVIHANESPTS